MQRPLAIAILLSLNLVSSLTLAGRKAAEDEGPQGMLMPELDKILGDAWQVPPELSDRASPGVVLEVTAEGYRRVMESCISAAPREHAVTNISMQSSLSGGVGWGATSANGAQSMKLSFVSPRVSGFDLIDFVPSDDCVEKLTRYAERGDVSRLVVVQEALMARVSGCEQRQLGVGAQAGGGSVGLSSSGACQMFSDAPVAVGVKAVPLAEIRELASLVTTTPDPLPPAPPPPVSSEPAAARPTSAVDWVAIPGGTYAMGQEGWHWSTPVHTVTVPDFEMTRTEVTVAQYRACVEAKVCTAPDIRLVWRNQRGDCNWKQADRADHPVTCVSRPQAETFARWVGGRLPSEAKWEYAARSGGKDWLYPWGNERATCDRVVMSQGLNVSGDINWGCGRGGTLPVCSRPAGNSIHGVCDLLGNVSEIVADSHFKDYEGAPADASPRTEGGRLCSSNKMGRVVMVPCYSIRGGAYHDRDAQDDLEKYDMVGAIGAAARQHAVSSDDWRKAAWHGFRVVR